MPKPLTPVLGRTLAELVVLALRAGGVSTVSVTVGQDAETISAHFREIGSRLGIAVDLIDVPDWELGNGASALQASAALAGKPFFLVMSDHLFDPRMLPALANASPEDGDICLAVDFDVAGIFDVEDVTRVRAADGRIEAIGKALEDWNAGDTGVFLCTAGLFEGLRRARERGLHGLSDGIQVLAAEGRARVADVTGLAWIDVDTEDALQEAKRILENDVALTSLFVDGDNS